MFRTLWKYIGLAIVLGLITSCGPRVPETFAKDCLLANKTPILEKDSAQCLPDDEVGKLRCLSVLKYGGSETEALEAKLNVGVDVPGVTKIDVGGVEVDHFETVTRQDLTPELIKACTGTSSEETTDDTSSTSACTDIRRNRPYDHRGVRNCTESWALEDAESKCRGYAGTQGGVKSRVENHKFKIESGKKITGESWCTVEGNYVCVFRPDGC